MKVHQQHELVSKATPHQTRLGAFQLLPELQAHASIRRNGRDPSGCGQVHGRWGY